jgi:GTP-binding protein Era
MEIPSDYRAGYIAIVGKPNVGKSTLMNGFLDFKLSIISPRPQTTRRSVMGIVSREKYQAVFLDTPGMLEPRYQLQKEMMRHVHAAIADADVLLYMIEMRRPVNEERADYSNVAEHLRILNPTRKPVICAINKVDQFEKELLLPMMEKLHALNVFEAVVPISALKEDGLDSLEKELKRIQGTGVRKGFHPCGNLRGAGFAKGYSDWKRRRCAQSDWVRGAKIN